MNRKAITFFLLKLRKVIAYKVRVGTEATFGGEIEVGKNNFDDCQRQTWMAWYVKNFSIWLN